MKKLLFGLLVSLIMVMNSTVAFAAPQDWDTYDREYANLEEKVNFMQLMFTPSRGASKLANLLSNHDWPKKAKRKNDNYNSSAALCGAIASMRLVQETGSQSTKNQLKSDALEFAQDYSRMKGDIGVGKTFRDIAYYMWNLRMPMRLVHNTFYQAFKNAPNDGLTAILYFRFKCSNLYFYDREYMKEEAKLLRQRFPDIGDFVILQAELENPSSYSGRTEHLNNNITNQMYYLYGASYIDQYKDNMASYAVIPVPKSTGSSGGYSGGGSSDSGYSDEELYYMDKQMKEDAARIEQDRLKAIPNIPDHW